MFAAWMSLRFIKFMVFPLGGPMEKASLCIYFLTASSQSSYEVGYIIIISFNRKREDYKI